MLLEIRGRKGQHAKGMQQALCHCGKTNVLELTSSIICDKVAATKILECDYYKDEGFNGSLFDMIHRFDNL